MQNEEAVCKTDIALKKSARNPRFAQLLRGPALIVRDPLKNRPKTTKTDTKTTKSAPQITPKCPRSPLPIQLPKSRASVR
jgi:hypothetical protein